MEHIPGSLRPPMRNTPREVMFAIGIENAPGDFGMTHGPAPTEEELLEVVPDDGAVLLRLNGDKPDDVLWRWAGDRWLTPEAPQTERVGSSALAEGGDSRLFALDSRQLASVLAGLRALQEDRTGRFGDITTDAGAFDALDAGEIEHLVRQIQFDRASGGVVQNRAATRVVLNVNGGVLEEAFADGAFELVVLDADLEGVDEDDVVEIEGQEVYPTVFAGERDQHAGARVDAIFAQLREHDGDIEPEQSRRPTPPDGEPVPSFGLLRSCHTVNQLLQGVQRAVPHIADPAVRQDLLDHLEPFSSGVAVAFYTRSEMAQQAPMDIEVTDAEADAALERLVRNFQHPWDEFSGQFGDEVHQRVLDALKAQRPREGA